MKNYSLYAQLELIETPFETGASGDASLVSRAWKKSKSGLAAIARSLLQSSYGLAEPSIRMRRDRQGKPYFTAYDPFSQTHHRFTSEQDVRIWLEERYYH